MSIEFDVIIDRHNTNCAKWDEMDEKYKSRELIHLGVADMDFQTPKAIRAEFERIVAHGIFGYTNLGEEFYGSIQGWMKEQIGEDIPKEWIVYCPRINIAGSLLVDIFTKKDESVMIHAPYYMPLYNAICKNKREVIESPLKWSGSRYEIDFEQMEKDIKKDTKMLLFCSPHNPCTTIFTEVEMKELEAFCIRHDLLLVSDEIHSDIRKKGVAFLSSLNLSDGLRQRLVYVNSPSKTFNIPGIILSYMIIPNPSIRNMVREEIDRIGMHNPNAFANGAVLKGYTECRQWLRNCNDYIDANEKFVRNFVKEHIPILKVMPREGTFLLWIDCKAMELTNEGLEKWFVKKAKVGVYAGCTFGSAGEGFIRINIAAPRTTLEEAFSRIKVAFETGKKVR